MYCVNCGTEMQDEAFYCVECGYNMAERCAKQAESLHGMPTPEPATEAIPEMPPTTYYGEMPAYDDRQVDEKPMRNKSIASMVCGICSIVFCETIIPSIVLAIIALVFHSQLKKGGYENTMSKAGMICGWVGICVTVLSIVFAILAVALTMSVISVGGIAAVSTCCLLV